MEEVTNYDLLVAEDQNGTMLCFLCKSHEAKTGDFVDVDGDLYRVVIRAWIGSDKKAIDVARRKIKEVTEVFASAWKRNT